MKKILFILLFSTLIFGQRQKKSLFIEANIFPNGNTSICYISYKTNYNSLVFQKSNNNYFAGLEFSIEVMDSIKIIDRESDSRKVKVNLYDLTEANDIYIEGFVSVELPKGFYSIKPSIKIDNTDKTISLSEFSIQIKDSDESKIAKPIIVENSKPTCSVNSLFRMVNFQNKIPFSTNEFYAVIPVFDSSITNLPVSIKQNDKIIFEDTLTQFRNANFIIDKCKDLLTLKEDASGVNLNYFILKDFSKILDEGSVIFTFGDDTLLSHRMNVSWINKPYSLSDLNFAISELKNIISEEEVSKIQDLDNPEKEKRFNDYWKNYDPNKSTKFNELMNEFYQRVDFALKNFSTATKRIGANSDRGKVYIKYGHPDKINRSFDANNKGVEIWDYINSNKRFVFIDQTGLGNYTLKE